MKHVIRTAVFAVVMASVLATEIASADRQGGGTLMVAKAFDQNMLVRVTDVRLPAFVEQAEATTVPTEYVRFKAALGDVVAFDYSWIDGASKGASEVIVSRASLGYDDAELVRALVNSKSTDTWVNLRLFKAK